MIKVITFTIPFRLPGMNEYIKAMNQNRYAGNKLKKDTEQSIMWFAKSISVVIDYPIAIEFEWHESSYRRDKDNVASAKKFILDAMQKCGVLSNDNNKYIKGFKDTFVYDKTDKVIVNISKI